MTGEHRTAIVGDIATLSERARHVNTAISLCTGSALLECTLVAVLFTSAFFTRDVSIDCRVVHQRDVMPDRVAGHVHARDSAGDGDVAHGEALTRQPTHISPPPHPTSRAPRQNGISHKRVTKNPGTHSSPLPPRASPKRPCSHSRSVPLYAMRAEILPFRRQNWQPEPALDATGERVRTGRTPERESCRQHFAF